MSIYTHKTYTMTCNNCGQPYRNDEQFADYDMLIFFAIKDKWEITYKGDGRGLKTLVSYCPDCRKEAKK